jgi:glycosyltransferase involved in cell wall biosynthesis
MTLAQQIALYKNVPDEKRMPIPLFAMTPSRVVQFMNMISVEDLNEEEGGGIQTMYPQTWERGGGWRKGGGKYCWDRKENDVGVDANFMADLEQHFPNGFILFVSQVLPHKRVDHALEILQLLRTVHRLDIGLVIAGPIRQPAYEFAVQTLRDKLQDSHLLMTNAVTDEQLATLYRACLCYIGTSEHEGLSVPPLEAMANSAPVVVLGAGAVPETVKTGGIVLPIDTGVIEFSEVVAEVITTGAQTILISPGALGFSNETVPDTNIQLAVTNKSGGTTTITVTLTAVQLEA